MLLECTLLAALYGAGSFVPAHPAQPKPPCKYEENCGCAVPGITVRWHAAYCMFLNATDDYENGGVTECLDRPVPNALREMTACDQNRYWKEQICRAREKEDEKVVRACVDDPEMMPRIVKFGPGLVPDPRPRVRMQRRPRPL